MRIDRPRGLRQSCCPMRRTALLLTVGIASVAVAQDSDVFILQEHTPAPAFSLRDLSGKTVDSKSLAGKVAVLSFGATWCSSCTSELKSLENLQAKFPKDLVVYFVAMDGRGDKDVKPYLEKHGHTIRTLIDPEMAVARGPGVRWLPATVGRDAQGMIVGRPYSPVGRDWTEALKCPHPPLTPSFLTPPHTR